MVVCTALNIGASAGTSKPWVILHFFQALHSTQILLHVELFPTPDKVTEPPAGKIQTGKAMRSLIVTFNTRMLLICNIIVTRCSFLT